MHKISFDKIKIQFICAFTNNNYYVVESNLK